MNTTGVLERAPVLWSLPPASATSFPPPNSPASGQILPLLIKVYGLSPPSRSNVGYGEGKCNSRKAGVGRFRQIGELAHSIRMHRGRYGKLSIATHCGPAILLVAINR